MSRRVSVEIVGSGRAVERDVTAVHAGLGSHDKRDCVRRVRVELNPAIRHLDHRVLARFFLARVSPALRAGMVADFHFLGLLAWLRKRLAA
jgi:hypothetical protein